MGKRDLQRRLAGEKDSRLGISKESLAKVLEFQGAQETIIFLLYLLLSRLKVSRRSGNMNMSNGVNMS